MSKKPWMKWYPADWRSDPKLRMCSLSARGLWADMLALMHEAEPYGHLLVAGKAPSDQQLAALVGAPAREVSAAIGQLADANVFSRTDDGTIYSRRMVRDKAKADQDSTNGRKGGNPKVIAPTNQQDNGGVNPHDKGGDKAQKLEARGQKLEGDDSAAVTSTPREPEPSPPAKPEGCAAPKWDGFAVWELWQERRQANGHATSPNPPSPAETATGQRWIDAGADRALIVQAFDAALGRKCAEPPRSLRYCEGAVTDALAVKRDPLAIPAGLRRGNEPASPEKVAETRLATYRSTGVWLPQWGPEPEKSPAGAADDPAGYMGSAADPKGHPAAKKSALAVMPGAAP